jgi:DNA-binding NarL/FixJ family response regulator
VAIIGDEEPDCRALASAVKSQPGLVLVHNARNGDRECAVNCAGVIDLVQALRPDVLLLDMLMVQCDSVEVIRLLGAQGAETRVLAYSSIVDDNLLLTALRAGAVGYIARTADPAEIAAAIRTVNAGASYLPSSLAHYLVHHFSISNHHLWIRAQRLTPREREVLMLVGEGCNNRKIAQHLNISAATVRIHVRHAQKKLALETRSQLAAFGAQFAAS